MKNIGGLSFGFKQNHKCVGESGFNWEGLSDTYLHIFVIILHTACAFLRGFIDGKKSINVSTRFFELLGMSCGSFVGLFFIIKVNKALIRLPMNSD